MCHHFTHLPKCSRLRCPRISKKIQTVTSRSSKPWPEEDGHRSVWERLPSKKQHHLGASWVGKHQTHLLGRGHRLMKASFLLCFPGNFFVCVLTSRNSGSITVTTRCLLQSIPSAPLGRQHPSNDQVQPMAPGPPEATSMSWAGQAARDGGLFSGLCVCRKGTCCPSGRRGARGKPYSSPPPRGARISTQFWGV